MRSLTTTAAVTAAAVSLLASPGATRRAAVSAQAVRRNCQPRARTRPVAA